MIARCQTVLTASGNRINPSHTAMHTSAVPRFLISVSSLRHHIGAGTAKEHRTRTRHQSSRSGSFTGGFTEKSIKANPAVRTPSGRPQTGDDQRPISR
jgi:hypothetical protein